VATIENLVNLGDVTLVQVSRSRPILDLTRFEAQNPVFVISWEKE
jgi:precorrin-6Y C5,15-methyltransferase (decarboxylating)